MHANNLSTPHSLNKILLTIVYDAMLKTKTYYLRRKLVHY